MENRETTILRMRPEMSSVKIFPGTCEEERFQNETLRPIARLQRDLLLAIFRNYIKKHKNVFYELSLERRLDYIENAIHKDTKFRNSLKGVIIGQFTLKEFEEYSKNSSALNKRMMEIIKDRFKSNIQLLTYEYA